MATESSTGNQLPFISLADVESMNGGAANRRRFMGQAVDVACILVDEDGKQWPVDLKLMVSPAKLADFEERWGFAFEEIQTRIGELKGRDPLELWAYVAWLSIRHLKGAPSLDWVRENLNGNHIQAITEAQSEIVTEEKKTDGLTGSS